MFMLLAAASPAATPQALGLTIVFGLLQTGGFVGLIMWAVSIGGAGKVSILSYTMPFWLLMLAWPILHEPVRGLQWARGDLRACRPDRHPRSVEHPRSAKQPAGRDRGLRVGAQLDRGQDHAPQPRHRPAHPHRLAGALRVHPADHRRAAHAPEPIQWTGTFIAALLFNVIPANALTWVLWLYILHSLSTGTAGLSSLAVPVVGVVSAWIQLGEQPGVLEAVGMGLIVIALAILTAREVAASQQRFAQPAVAVAPTSAGTRVPRPRRGAAASPVA